MSKAPKTKTVTMRGGKNVAAAIPTPEKTPKPDTAEPENQKPAATKPPEEPSE